MNRECASAHRDGTSRTWRKNFYPPGLVQRRELEYAAERLTTLEINTTFHGLPQPSSYLSWIAETPDDFVFSVKGNKSVTHDNSLMNPARNVAEFFASGILGLGEKRGPTLWQTPASSVPSRDSRGLPCFAPAFGR